MHAASAIVALDPSKDRGSRAPAASMDKLRLQGEKLTINHKQSISRGESVNKWKERRMLPYH
jgi:hypothetical protein